MDDSPSPPSARQYPGLLALCGLLWLLALVLAGAGAWILIRSGSLLGLLAVLVALAMSLAGVGLYRLRRWGVILFGLLAGLASIDHLSRALLTYRSLPPGNLLAMTGALFSILGSIAIPMIMIYLVLILWRRAR